MDAPEILTRANELGVLRSQGKTPANTMRARISDEIRRQGGASQFVRVGPNRFGLREWKLTEYHSRPFEKALPDEITVCVYGGLHSKLSDTYVGLSAISLEFLKYIQDKRNISFVDRRIAEATTEYRQLIAYAWLETSDSLVLAYTRGKYSSAHRTLLLGKKSVGFGGHVLKKDAESLFGAEDAGIREAALREIGEELGGQLPITLSLEGIIWDNTSFEGQKHIGVVMRGGLPSSRELSELSSEYAINQLQLLTKEQLWAEYHAMEFWSQLLIRKFASEAKPNKLSVIVPAKRPPRVAALAVVGEIANGKSSIAKALSERRGYSVISASDVLRRLLGIRNLSERDRSGFQAMALKFIKSEDGPDRLAHEIANEVSRAGSDKVIIDGLRQLATLESLRKRVPGLIVLFIDCPRDIAFSNYQQRLSTADPKRFAEVREHEVELELPEFRFEADAVLHNADSLEATLDVLLRWLDGN